jgi:acyl-CoA dehydrogenase
MSSSDLFNLQISDNFVPVLEQVKHFIHTEISPVEEEFHNTPHKDDIWTLSDRQSEIIESLKAKAQEQGLWNFFLPDWNGEGVSNLDYAYLAQEMGKSRLAPEVFNCAAPDTGNMEVLAKYGSEAQQKAWLEPLLAGKIRSAFAMTEPEVASSDAKNIATTAMLDGDEWVINGEKFYISGAGDKRCAIMIVMVRTSDDPDTPVYQRQSQILVPMDNPGVEILGPMHVFGNPDAPHGHMHLRFNNCRVPKDNILLGEGRGFEISQGRLGPGRIHHCMRALGMAELALEMIINRGLSREAFGKPLVKLGGNFDIVANARIDIDSCRLMVLQAAKAMDTLGNSEARVYISGIKALVPEVTCKIIDQAIQMYGAAGVSQWTPLADMYTGMRTLRLADGPDEVHRMVVARAEIKKYL